MLSDTTISSRVDSLLNYLHSLLASCEGLFLSPGITESLDALYSQYSDLCACSDCLLLILRAVQSNSFSPSLHASLHHPSSTQSIVFETHSTSSSLSQALTTASVLTAPFDPTLLDFFRQKPLILPTIPEDDDNKLTTLSGIYQNFYELIEYTKLRAKYYNKDILLFLRHPFLPQILGFTDILAKAHLTIGPSAPASAFYNVHYLTSLCNPIWLNNHHTAQVNYLTTLFSDIYTFLARFHPYFIHDLRDIFNNITLGVFQQHLVEKFHTEKRFNMTMRIDRRIIALENAHNRAIFIESQKLLTPPHPTNTAQASQPPPLPINQAHSVVSSQVPNVHNLLHHSNPGPHQHTPPHPSTHRDIHHGSAQLGPESEHRPQPTPFLTIPRKISASHYHPSANQPPNEHNLTIQSQSQSHARTHLPNFPINPTTDSIHNLPQTSTPSPHLSSMNPQPNHLSRPSTPTTNPTDSRFHRRASSSGHSTCSTHSPCPSPKLSSSKQPLHSMNPTINATLLPSIDLSIINIVDVISQSTTIPNVNTDSRSLTNSSANGVNKTNSSTFSTTEYPFNRQISSPIQSPTTSLQTLTLPTPGMRSNNQSSVSATDDLNNSPSNDTPRRCAVSQRSPQQQTQCQLSIFQSTDDQRLSFQTQITENITDPVKSSTTPSHSIPPHQYTQEISHETLLDKNHDVVPAKKHFSPYTARQITIRCIQVAHPNYTGSPMDTPPHYSNSHNYHSDGESPFSPISPPTSIPSYHHSFTLLISPALQPVPFQSDAYRIKHTKFPTNGSLPIAARSPYTPLNAPSTTSFNQTYQVPQIHRTRTVQPCVVLASTHHPQLVPQHTPHLRTLSSHHTASYLGQSAKNKPLSDSHQPVMNHQSESEDPDCQPEEHDPLAPSHYYLDVKNNTQLQLQYILTNQGVQSPRLTFSASWFSLLNEIEMFSPFVRTVMHNTGVEIMTHVVPPSTAPVIPHGIPLLVSIPYLPTNGKLPAQGQDGTPILSTTTTTTTTTILAPRYISIAALSRVNSLPCATPALPTTFSRVSSLSSSNTNSKGSTKPFHSNFISPNNNSSVINTHANVNTNTPTNIALHSNPKFPALTSSPPQGPLSPQAPNTPTPCTQTPHLTTVELLLPNNLTNTANNSPSHNLNPAVSIPLQSHDPHNSLSKSPRNHSAHISPSPPVSLLPLRSSTPLSPTLTSTSKDESTIVQFCRDQISKSLANQQRSALPPPHSTSPPPQPSSNSTHVTASHRLSALSPIPSVLSSSPSLIAASLSPPYSSSAEQSSSYPISPEYLHSSPVFSQLPSPIATTPPTSFPVSSFSASKSSPKFPTLAPPLTLNLNIEIPLLPPSPTNSASQGDASSPVSPSQKAHSTALNSPRHKPSTALQNKSPRLQQQQQQQQPHQLQPQSPTHSQQSQQTTSGPAQLQILPILITSESKRQLLSYNTVPSDPTTQNTAVLPRQSNISNSTQTPSPATSHSNTNTLANSAHSHHSRGLTSTSNTVVAPSLTSLSKSASHSSHSATIPTSNPSSNPSGSSEHPSNSSEPHHNANPSDISKSSPNSSLKLSTQTRLKISASSIQQQPAGKGVIRPSTGASCASIESPGTNRTTSLSRYGSDYGEEELDTFPKTTLHALPIAQNALTPSIPPATLSLPHADGDFSHTPASNKSNILSRDRIHDHSDGISRVSSRASVRTENSQYSNSRYSFSNTQSVSDASYSADAVSVDSDGCLDQYFTSHRPPSICSNSNDANSYFAPINSGPRFHSHNVSQTSPISHHKTLPKPSATPISTDSSLHSIQHMGSGSHSPPSTSQSPKHRTIPMHITLNNNAYKTFNFDWEKPTPNSGPFQAYTQLPYLKATPNGISDQLPKNDGAPVTTIPTNQQSNNNNNDNNNNNNCSATMQIDSNNSPSPWHHSRSASVNNTPSPTSNRIQNSTTSPTRLIATNDNSKPLIANEDCRIFDPLPISPSSPIKSKSNESSTESSFLAPITFPTPSSHRVSTIRSNELTSNGSGSVHSEHERLDLALYQLSPKARVNNATNRNSDAQNFFQPHLSQTPPQPLAEHPYYNNTSPHDHPQSP